MRGGVDFPPPPPPLPVFCAGMSCSHVPSISFVNPNPIPMKSPKSIIALIALSLLAAGASFAADAKKEAAVSKQAGCCAKAEAKGEKCTHECCVAAAKEGKNCE